MLNSIIAMRKRIYSIFFILIFAIPAITVSARQEALYEVKISSPTDGAAVQGIVEILGNTETDDFLNYEISFSLSTNGASALRASASNRSTSVLL